MTHTTTSITRWWDSRASAGRHRVASLKTVRSGLILALAPFLLACEDDNFLSLPADPSQQNLDIRRTRIPVPFQIVRFDSLETSPTSRDSKKLLTGSFQNSELGVATAISYINFNVGSRATVGDTAAYESLVLELLYERSYGAPQVASNQTLNIRALDQQLASFDSVPSYYNSNTLAVKESVIGSASISTNFTSEVDTLQFRLSDVLGQEMFNLAQAGDSTVISDSLFSEFLPGIALTPNTNGSINSFSPSGTRLILNFTDAKNEPKQYTFTIRRFFNRIMPDFSGTTLTELNTSDNGTMPNDGNLYLQSGTGVAPRIGFDSLIAFVRSQTTNQQSILLNRVDFNVGLRKEQDTLNAPAALFIYDLVPDSLGVLRRFPLLSTQNQFLGYLGVIDQSAPGQASAAPLDGTQYSLPVTSYLSALVETDTLNQRLYLWSNNFDSSLSHFVTSGDSIYLDVQYTVLTRTD